MVHKAMQKFHAKNNMNLNPTPTPTYSKTTSAIDGYYSEVVALWYHLAANYMRYSDTELKVCIFHVLVMIPL